MMMVCCVLDSHLKCFDTLKKISATLSFVSCSKTFLSCVKTSLLVLKSIDRCCVLSAAIFFCAFEARVCHSDVITKSKQHLVGLSFVELNFGSFLKCLRAHQKVSNITSFEFESKIKYEDLLKAEKVKL